MAAAQVEFEAAEARRATPEARAERERSREQYRGLGRADAIGLAKDSFRGVFGHPAFTPFQMPPGKRVREFVGSEGAVLVGDDPEGNQFVESMGIPLTSTLGSGEREFLHLGLRDAGDGFEPRNPAVPTRIGRDGTARVGREGIGIRVVGGGSGDEVAQDDGRLFFANALLDTDVVVTPTALGISFAFQVRSAAAPEETVLDLDLPAGTELRLAAFAERDRLGVELVRGGEVIARIDPPVAWDADEQPLPVSYALDGDRVVVSFPHRGKDVRYPLFVDPEMNENFGPSLARTWDEWGLDWSGTPWWGTQTGATEAKVWNIWDWNYPAGHWGALAWQNLRGYISWLDVFSFTHYHSFTQGKVGILNSAKTAWKRVYSTGDPDNSYTRMVSNYTFSLNNINGDVGYGDWAMLQLFMPVAGNRTWQGYAQTSGIRASLADNEDPDVNSADSVPNSTGGAWVKGGSTVTVSPTASDAGLGVAAINLYAPGGAVTQFARPNAVMTSDSGLACSGLRGNRCPQGNVTAQLQFNTNSLPTSSTPQQLGGNAYDALYKPTTYYTSLKIDKALPDISLSGALWDKNAAWAVNQYNDVVPSASESEWPRLDIDITDPASGVKTTSVYVHPDYQVGARGDLQWTSTRTSACDGCHEDTWWRPDPRNWRGKTIRITVVASDFAGNEREVWFPVHIGSIDTRTSVHAYGANALGTAQLDANLPKMVSADLRLVRMTFSAQQWRDDGKQLECVKSQDVNNTTDDNCTGQEGYLDKRMLKVLEHDVSLLPILIDKRECPDTGTLPPGCGSIDDEYIAPPTDTLALEEWKDFVEAVVLRYGPRDDAATPPRGTFWRDNPRVRYRPIRAWEVWNEQNYESFWPTGPNVAQYYAVLSDAREKLRAYDSGARIIFGGLAGKYVGDDVTRLKIDPQDYVHSFMQMAQSQCRFEALGSHPYFPDAAEVDDKVWELTDELDAAGATGRPVWVTELGWSSGSLHALAAGGTPEQANNLAAAYSGLRSGPADRVGPILWYQIRDHSPAAFWFHNAGLLAVNGDEKDAWSTMRYWSEGAAVLPLPPAQPLSC